MVSLILSKNIKRKKYIPIPQNEKKKKKKLSSICDLLLIQIIHLDHYLDYLNNIFSIN